MSTIYLETMGGLANRMRLLASGLWLKQMVESRLIGFWEENDALNCPYHLLFENIDGLEMIPKGNKFRFVQSSNDPFFLKKQKTYWLNKLIGVDYCLEERDFGRLIWSGKLDIGEAKKKYPRMYFKTFEEFGDNKDEFRKFKPVAQLSSIIDNVTANFSPATIGVHIRRTDNKGAIENSPTELFIDAMKNELELDSSVRFFLCTDDATVEKSLKNIFGSNLLTYPKELSRQSQKGIQDALVDMFCLAQTNKIYGSYWSSFSEIAARIKGSELKSLKK